MPRAYEVDTWACPECDVRIMQDLYNRHDADHRCGSCAYASIGDYIFVPSNLTTTQGVTMQCQLVSLDGVCDRLVPSVADGRVMRDLMMEEYGVAKKAVTITPEEVPTNKVDLLDYINRVLARVDGTPRPK